MYNSKIQINNGDESDMILYEKTNCIYKDNENLLEVSNVQNNSLDIIINNTTLQSNLSNYNKILFDNIVYGFSASLNDSNSNTYRFILYHINDLGENTENIVTIPDYLFSQYQNKNVVIFNDNTINFYNVCLRNQWTYTIQNSTLSEGSYKLQFNIIM